MRGIAQLVAMSRIQTINRRSGRSSLSMRVPPTTRLTPVYVVSGTLERVYRVEAMDCTVLTGVRGKREVIGSGNKHTVMVLAKPSPSQLEMGCDGCGSAHNSANVRCMANTPESLLHATPGYMYNRDRKCVRKFQFTEVVHGGKARSVITLDKIANER